MLQLRHSHAWPVGTRPEEAGCGVGGVGWGDTGMGVTVRTHCPDPAARGEGGGSGQAPSWHPELAAYRCFFRPDGVHRAPPHEDSHHRRHHPSLGADGDGPQACVQARITRISSAGHRERPPLARSWAWYPGLPHVSMGGAPGVQRPENATRRLRVSRRHDRYACRPHTSGPGDARDAGTLGGGGREAAAGVRQGQE